jgi:excisionase family DNA binding protein
MERRLLLTVDEAAERLRVSPDTIRRSLRDKKLLGVRVGGQWRIPEQALQSKEQLLEEAGYAFHSDREIFRNRKGRKVFSLEFVEDHTVTELVDKINEPSVGNEWRFYFNSPPSEATKLELSRSSSNEGLLRRS